MEGDNEYYAAFDYCKCSHDFTKSELMGRAEEKGTDHPLFVAKKAQSVGSRETLLHVLEAAPPMFAGGIGQQIMTIAFCGSSLFSVGNLIRQVQPRSAERSLLKVESGIN